ncbi:MAG: hypothetical protein HY543_07310 [Deltaproteobacteria bacterium]|nr:hypothetical protein [Deltaproteobacteria bacterium]
MESWQPQAQPKGRAKFEWVSMCCIIIAGVGLTGGLHMQRAQTQKAEVLMQDLSQLRSAIALYKTVKQQNPPSLAVLLSETYQFGNEAPRHYVTNLALAAEGNRLLDPFGQAYAYDPHVGWIRSVSKGYEQW